MKKAANEEVHKRVIKDIKNMPVRQYLDHTVVPIILQALTELAKERFDLYHV
jgi:hypothetical protein